MQTSCDRFCRGIRFELENDPLSSGRCREGKSVAFGLDRQFFRGLTCATSCGQFLLFELHGFHVVIQQGDGDLAVLFGDFRVQRLIGAEFENAAFVRTEFDSLMREHGTDGGEEHKCDVFPFHRVDVVVVCFFVRVLQVHPAAKIVARLFFR